MPLSLSTLFGWLHLQAHLNFLKSVLVYRCINGVATYLPNEFWHAHQIHFHFTTRENMISCGCLWLKPPKYQGSFRLSVVPASRLRPAIDFNTFKSSAERHYKCQSIQSLHFYVFLACLTFCVLIFFVSGQDSV